MMPDMVRQPEARCNALVLYYSWTGNTAKVATAIAEALQCDVEPIVEMRPREGRGAAFRCMLDTLFRRRPPIREPRRNLSDYDVVIVGGPVWARSVAGPLRTFLRRYTAGMRRAAVFCTEAGQGGETVLDIVTQAMSVAVVARCVISQADFSSDAWLDKTAAFASAIRADIAAGRLPDAQKFAS